MHNLLTEERTILRWGREYGLYFMKAVCVWVWRRQDADSGWERRWLTTARRCWNWNKAIKHSVSLLGFWQQANEHLNRLSWMWSKEKQKVLSKRSWLRQQAKCLEGISAPVAVIWLSLAPSHGGLLCSVWVNGSSSYYLNPEVGVCVEGEENQK